MSEALNVAVVSDAPLVRSVVIDCHIEDVFEYVADPSNDPAWRAHRPIARTECVAPSRVAWREHDRALVIEVTYELETVWTSTRVTQRHEARMRGPRVLHPWARLRLGRAAARQLRALKQALER
jgi:hypothetical protein